MNCARRLGEMMTRRPVRVLLAHEIARGCLSHVIGCVAKDLDEEMAQYGLVQTASETGDTTMTLY
jgi:hypothetical protein